MSFTPQGVTFDGKHSYTDFGLWMMSRPDLGSPTPKLSIVDIPGADGNIDLTEANTGEVKYNNRTITLSFGAVVEQDEQEEFRTNIMNALHGKRISKIVLDEDPEWYWTGRASVSFTKVNSWRMNCTVSIDAAPYAQRVEQTVINLRAGAPSSYNVPIAENVSDTEWNSEFLLGTREFPNGLPLDNDQNLIILWLEGAQTGILANKFVQVIDADGNYYQDTFQLPQANNRVTISYSDIEDGGVDLSKVYRILVGGIGGCAAVVTKTSVRHQIINDRKTVMPVFGLSATDSVKIMVNGKEHIIDVGTNTYDDILLKAGENNIYIPSLGQNVYGFSMSYREGKL